MIQVSSSEKFIDLVKRSGLVEESRLSTFLEKLRSEVDGRLPDAKEVLAKKLVEAGLLTSWQADKLLDGKRGFILGKYKLLDHLGKGGMSNVYLAEHMMMQRRVAIKVLPPHRVKDKGYLHRFQQEARAAARLDHPNIVHAYDVDNVGDTHFLVMEYVDGKDLHVFVNDIGPLDYEMAADFILQASRGLAHAHGAGLVHRDIKPANLLVDQRKTVKVLDMGLARIIETEDPSLTLAHEESILGTADYLAPEQALHSHSADHRSDLYSLGCTLYFLLTGHPPFNQGTIRERLLKHQVETPPSVYKDRPDAPPGLVNICNRMMSKKPENRYQSAEEVAQALEGWLKDRGFDSGSTGSSGGLRRPEGVSGSGEFSIGRMVRTFPPPQVSMETTSGSGRDTSRIDDDEEIGLAPLDDEDHRVRKPSSEALSGSDILGRKDAAVSDEAAEPESPSASTSTSDSTKSLLEEELEQLASSVSQSGGGSLPSHSGVRDARGLGSEQDSQTDSTNTILLWLLVGAGTIIAILLLWGISSLPS